MQSTQFQALAFKSTELITCNWGNKAETDPVCVPAGGDQKGLCASQGRREQSASSPAPPQVPPGAGWVAGVGAVEAAQPRRRVPSSDV